MPTRAGRFRTDGEGTRRLGRAAWDAARDLDKALEDFAADIASLSGELRGELRLALLDATAFDPNNRLSRAIERFRDLAPNVRLLIAQERPQDIPYKLRDGQYHCAINSHRGRLEGLAYEHLYTERHSLYCGRGHPAFAASDAKLGDGVLAGFPFVHRGYWRDEDSLNAVDWNIQATVYQIDPQLTLIQSGRFIGLLPDHYVTRTGAGETLRAIRPSDLFYTCRFELVTPGDRRMPDVAQAFAQTIRSCWAVASSGTAAAR